MAKGRIVSAIEIGSSKTVTLISQVATDTVTFDTTINIVGVASVASRGIKKGQIVNIEEAVEATILSVEAAERMAGYNLSRAYVSLGGAHISSQNSHGVVAVSNPEAEITPADVDRVIEAASAVSLPTSREVIHVLPREFVVDGEAGVKDPVGMSGVRLETETHLVTAAAAAVKNLRKAVNEVGVEVDELVFSGLAAAESTISATEKELGCVVIDIGGGTTSIAVFLDGALSYSGVIPIGARNVTNDLAIGLRITLESAEKIKVALSELDKKERLKKPTEGSDQLDLKTLGVDEVKNVSKKTLTEGIIRPRLNEIFTMVRLELEKANLASRMPSGAIITGGGAETVGVVESARHMLSLPARVGMPQGVSGLIDDVVSPAFAVPVGLILYGAKQVPGDSGKSLGGGLRLPTFPTGGVLNKIVESLRDLLP